MDMRRLISKESLRNGSANCLDPRRESVERIISKIPLITNFSALAKLMDMSYGFVRQRLMLHPERLHPVGRQHKVPQAVAIEFVRSQFS